MTAMRQITAHTESDLREAIAGLMGHDFPVTSTDPNEDLITLDAKIDSILPVARAGSCSSVATLSSIASSLEGFLDLMQKWNRVYNLTAITDRKQMITHHLLDSLAIIPSLDGLLAGHDHPRVLDVGTGAGLPGIPLAVARPEWRLTLVDSNSKKTAFVTQAAAELGLDNINVATGRVEQQKPHPAQQQPPQQQPQPPHQQQQPQPPHQQPPHQLQQSSQPHDATYDAIVSRAFASLNDFVAGTRQLLATDGTWIAMKGVVPQDEIDALPDDIACTSIVSLDVPGLDAERHLILMKVKR